MQLPSCCTLLVGQKQPSTHCSVQAINSSMLAHVRGQADPHVVYTIMLLVQGGTTGVEGTVVGGGTVGDGGTTVRNRKCMYHTLSIHIPAASIIIMHNRILS